METRWILYSFYPVNHILGGLLSVRALKIIDITNETIPPEVEEV